jgi:hypothetical protein
MTRLLAAMMRDYSTGNDGKKIVEAQRRGMNQIVGCILWRGRDKHFGSDASLVSR